MVGLLAGTLNGARLAGTWSTTPWTPKTPSNTGQAIVAVDIATFSDVQAFKQEVDEVWES